MMALTRAMGQAFQSDMLLESARKPDLRALPWCQVINPGRPPARTRPRNAVVRTAGRCRRPLGPSR